MNRLDAARAFLAATELSVLAVSPKFSIVEARIACHAMIVAENAKSDAEQAPLAVDPKAFPLAGWTPAQIADHEAVHLHFGRVAAGYDAAAAREPGLTEREWVGRNPFVPPAA